MRSILRILDAALNRAREALRVLEDAARFHHADSSMAAALKHMRHGLDVRSRPYSRRLLEARDSVRDVGRDKDQAVRGGRPFEATVTANFKRAEEALRTVEEFSKGAFAALSAEANARRYELYELQRRMSEPRRRLAAARLYVLLDPAIVRGPLCRVAREALRGGADILQLRQKPRVDLGLAREIRAIARDALFIVNDRVDIALAAGADGVHLGLEDMPVEEARRLGVGIIGATTHSLGEARRVVAAGADYISVGPMFATALKPDLAARGGSYLGAVKKLGVPFFCIGGITPGNVRPAMKRVAVCAAVIAARDPHAAVRALRRGLGAV